MDNLFDWFNAVPIFQPVDPGFSLLSYFVDQRDIEDYFLGEQDCIDFNFSTKKFVSDFVENPDIEFIANYREFLVYWDNDEQTVLICQGEKAWESESINLLNLDYIAQSLGDNILKLAQQFLDALIFEQSYSPGQLQLELAPCTH